MKRQNDGIDVEGKWPWFHWYPDDFERDLQMLSLSAQGLWARMLGWMHHSPHRGLLELPTSEPMTESDIAARIGRPKREVKSALSELERAGVMSKDARGCILSRRMEKDTRISSLRRVAAKGRSATAGRDEQGRFLPGSDQNGQHFAGHFAGAKNPITGQQKPVVSGIRYQDPEKSSSSLEEIALSDGDGGVPLRPVIITATAPELTTAPAPPPQVIPTKTERQAAAELVQSLSDARDAAGLPVGSPDRAIAAASLRLTGVADLQHCCDEMRENHAAFLPGWVAAKAREPAGFVPFLSVWFSEGDCLRRPRAPANASNTTTGRPPIQTEFRTTADYLRYKKARLTNAG